jgi:di/tricarboxylate transporter
VQERNVTADIALVLGILAVTIVLFVSDRLRLDLVALLALLALTLTGILTPAEAAAGFGDTTVLLIAALFVVGEGLLQTGVAAALGRWLGRIAGTSEARILALTMLVVAPMSAFISSTGAVAIMLPVVVAVAGRAGLSPSRLLIPLAYGALIGGMLTLIGTPPNLIASDALVAAGRPPLGFFSLTPVGLLVLGAALALLVTLGRRLLPARVAAAEEDAAGAPSQAELLAAYGVQDRLVRVRVGPGSSLAGSTVGESGLRQRFGATVIAARAWSPRRRRHGPATPAGPATPIAEGDLLDLQLPPVEDARLLDALGLEVQAGEAGLDPELLVVEVALTPRSRFVGRTLRDMAVRKAYGVGVLGVQRLGQPLGGDFAGEELRFGDTLLAVGARQALAPLVEGQRFYGDFVVATVPAGLGREGGELTPRAPAAVAITLAMLVVMAGGWLSPMVAALAAALALVLSGCVRAGDLYRRMSWESLVLIGAMLPMATALSKTGGTALIADGLVVALGPFGPVALLAGIFVLTALFSQFISNTATAVLIMPIALASARGVGVAPEPLLVTAAIAASAAFATPIASPVNTLVLKAGGYRFADYARAGLPLQLLVLLICLLVVPLLFPF